MASTNELYDRVKVRLKMHLVDWLDTVPNNHKGQVPRETVEQTLRQSLRAVTDELRLPALPAADETRLVHETISAVLGYDLLDDLLADPTVSEVMINGPQDIFVERDGRIEPVPSRFRDANHLMSVVERMLSRINLSVSESSPVCDGSLPDGSRINVIIPPLALNGPVVTIRRAGREWTMDEFIARNVLSRQAAEFLQACVKAKVNLVISGGTSVGKTTLVAILCQAIAPQERVITIENVAELQLQGLPHWVRLVSKPPNLDGRGEIPLRVLVKNALRMRPDRLILGEARGGEALDVVQAMHTGHEGVITVLHGNSPQAALERLETLMLMSGLDLPPSACRMQIASAVDVVVHMNRFADNSRRIASIAQTGSSADGFQLDELFKFDVRGFRPDGTLEGELRYTGARPKCSKKFQLHNISLPGGIAA